MLSARAIYREIRDDDRTFQLFVSVAAAGEEQGGWENARIAELTRDEELSGKIRRHGEDEDKHGRLFAALLRKRGLQSVEVPPEVNYTMLLEAAGIGLSHARLRENDPLSDGEIIAYLVHSRVTEQRAAEEKLWSSAGQAYGSLQGRDGGRGIIHGCRRLVDFKIES